MSVSSVEEVGNGVVVGIVVSVSDYTCVYISDGGLFRICAGYDQRYRGALSEIRADLRCVGIC